MKNAFFSEIVYLTIYETKSILNNGLLYMVFFDIL